MMWRNAKRKINDRTNDIESKAQECSPWKERSSTEKEKIHKKGRHNYKVNKKKKARIEMGRQPLKKKNSWIETSSTTHI